ncbi:uncharacterized protein [Phaseolus vulgaris]|uniref:uncharacterized protein n=1 Tax=Phaseolus vulgaris TaxID=3885 RepID=UPI0035CB7859
MSGKDRRKALLELAKLRGAKGTGSSSSTIEPIASPPLSVAPAEGPEQGRKRRKLVKAFPSSAAAAPSTKEESSGSPLVHRKRKLPAVEGASSLQPGEIEVVEVEEVGELESTKEAAATGEKKLEEVVGKLSEAKGQLEEAASSLAALTTEKNAAEASKQKLEAEKADLMNVGADALTDGFELALEQIRCVLPDLDLSQFNIYHEVVDGKLTPPP